MNKTKICIIGGRGYVGKSLVAFFNSHDSFTTYVKEKDYQAVGCDEAEIAIVCVPTQMAEDGFCDTSIVQKVVEECKQDIILIKSAVPPGTTDLLKIKTGKRIVVSPEYIGEGKYTMPYWQNLPHPTDMTKHDFQIFGGDRKDTNIFVELFSRILGPYCRFYQTNPVTAELTKYMENCFFATKITFCHEFSRIAEVFGVDYHELRELWLADGRVNRGSSAVFDMENRGYGGKCLPKDISAIYHAAKFLGHDSGFLKQVMQTNSELRGDK